jgi:alpha-amylase/alpha-mannosidase (GH57 family)
MNNRPLNLAILWHMHQPYYKDLVSGEFILPWVRLHAIKDYFDMVAVLEKFPNVRMSFNLVPSLLAQIEDYVKRDGVDKYLEVTLKDPKDLTLEEKIFILQNFFMTNWEIMVKPYLRYYHLLVKRGRFVSPAELQGVAQRFSPQEFLDLQVWFNLSWFGFIYKEQDPVISELVKKGKRFTPEDKKALIEKQKEVLARIIPLYRSAEERGQIEISTSPFYHPILPLLCDTNVARESMPNILLPEVPFRHPEDAEAQVKKAVEYHARRFGKPPAGMWPSEGSVSEQVIPIIAGAGIKWIATDEGILAHTLRKIESRSRSLSAEELYQPYLMEKEGASLAMLFRNHFLSDQIGFVYYRWNVQDAVGDFMTHLDNIRLSLPDDGKNYLVTVILDGENAWEYYPGQGKEFLEAFYDRLSKDPMLRTVKIGEYLAENPPRKKLSKLFAGSWINDNFRIWIGHPEDNTAWKYLNAARLVLQETDEGQAPVAWQELLIAEGSDWCWWYGDDHSSENDAAFDLLFRKHLKNIYHILNKPAPSYLESPIKKARLLRPLKEPVYLIKPVLDGKITNYYEWLAAGHFDIAKARGAMHQIETVLREVYYGFSQTDLYLRLDLNYHPAAEEMRSISYALVTYSPVQCRTVVCYLPEENRFVCRFFKMEEDKFVFAKEIQSFAVGKIVELGIPFSDLCAGPGDRVGFVVVISKDGLELERWPKDGMIAVNVPTENYEQEQWSV